MLSTTRDLAPSLSGALMKSTKFPCKVFLMVEKQGMDFSLALNGHQAWQKLLVVVKLFS